MNVTQRRDPGARVVLVTGGSRSGKSAYAQKMAESLPGRKAYVATCPVVDDEIAERIERHKEERIGKGWETIEEPLFLAEALRRSSDCPVVLVDCLTLWVNNHLYEAEKIGRDLSEEEMARLCAKVLEACEGEGRTVIFVTNEVGMGLVPADRGSRRYRDLAGRANQVIGAAADQVTLVVSGIPLQLKESEAL